MTDSVTLDPVEPPLSVVESKLAAAVPVLERNNEQGCLLDQYHGALPAARRSIMHRLVASIVREDIGGLGSESVVYPLSGSTDRDLELPTPPGGSLETVCDRFSALPAEASALLVAPLSASDGALVVPVADEWAFDRLDPCGTVVRYSEGTVTPVRRPTELLDRLWSAGRLSGATVKDRRRFAEEVENSVANLALSYTQRECRERAIRHQAAAEGWKSVRQYLSAGRDPLVRSEQLVVEGHPLHPGAKLRDGLRPAEIVAYGSEYEATPNLRFVALRADHVSTASTDASPSLTARLYDHVPGLQPAVERAVSRVGLDPDTVSVLPVHPWQYQHVLPERYADARRCDAVVPVPEVSLPADATVSLRTLVPRSTTGEGPRPHLKVALGVQTTGTVRTISPQTIHNGPPFSEILKTVLSAGDHSLTALPEAASACFHPPGGPHAGGEGYDDARHLSALARENPQTVVADDALPVVPSALVARSPLEERPVVASFLDDRTPAAARSFLRSYARTVVPGYLGLLVGYGIGMEAHLQNCVVVFRNGEPTRVLARDFGGTRIAIDRLRARGFDFDPYPGSVTTVSRPDPAYDKLTYALFQNHLAELVRAVCGWTGASEADCWREISAVCADTLDRLRETDIPADWITEAETVLFAPTWNYKCMTQMRLSDRSRTYSHSEVPNPLNRPH